MDLISKYELALKQFAKMFNNEKLKYKYKLLTPIRKAGLTKKQAEKLDFKISKRMWQSCLNENVRNQGGRPKLDKSLIQRVNEHLDENSTTAANRFLKKQKSCAKYRSLTLRRCYESFHLKKSLSYSSFYKHIQKKYVKPHRFSDLCVYCENNKVNIFMFILYIVILF